MTIKSISNARRPAARRVRLGFIALIDAAPIVAARELGYFADEGLDVVLSRELGWANVRDKLAFGGLDAAAALIGLPIRSAIGDGAFGEPIRTVMSLGTGGDAITLSKRLTDAGVNSAAMLGQYIRQSRRTLAPLVFAHVFESSVHHYLLREWLAGGDVDPDRDVRLCVQPPPQMGTHLAAQHIDGFCVGEPWNSLASEHGVGRIVALTSDLAPGHPDKVLAVNERWAEQEPDAVVALIRATLGGAEFCSNPANFPELSAILARPNYLDVSAQTVMASLLLDRNFGAAGARSPTRPHDWRMRSFDTTFPSQTHAAWVVSMMQRWGHAEPELDPWEVAARATNSAAYHLAAAQRGIACPDTDAPAMRLRNGQQFERPSIHSETSDAAALHAGELLKGVRS